jgi:hypothetical protein
MILEDTRNLIAGQNHRDFALRRPNPLGKFALSVRVRTIHFIQHQTQGLRVIPKQGCDASCVTTRLNQGFDIRKTADGLTRIDFKNLEATRPHCRQRKCGLADSRRTMKKQNIGIWGSPKIGTKTVLHLGMSHHLFEDFGSPSFTPHALSS